jgi:polyphosphate glucokinase
MSKNAIDTMEEQALVACHALPQMIQETLAIDIGGSGLRAAVLDQDGNLLSECILMETPIGAHPDTVVTILAEFVSDLPAYTRISSGFPGMVRDGIIRSAPNLGHDDWCGYDLAGALQDALGRPARVANDADVQGLAAIAGEGVEMVITLGMGFGTALYQNGQLCPHLEISQQPFRKGESYDQHLGNFARKAVGNKKWQNRVILAIENMRALTHFDQLYIGGANAKRMHIDLPDGVSIIDSMAGIHGGANLWRV